MGRKFSFAIDEYYHIYNRGTDKRTIFLDEEDWQRFSALLYLCNSERNIVFRDIPIGLAYGYERGETFIDIGAYCLMPNHFHFLAREKIQNGISLFMQKFSTAYSMYFNIKYERSGGLFEGPFRAKHVDNDNYLKYLFSYIHLNPIKLIEPEWKNTGVANKKVAEDFLKNYRYSSYDEYSGTEREEAAILTRSFFPEYFDNQKDFNAFIKDWIE